MAKDYSHLSKEELIKKIEKLESRKKYGLIWDEERTKEKFEKDAENALPVLREISSKEITDKNLSKPVNILPVNILIEGDNYHALSVLNFTHQEAIDLIYIDPPYNTGNKDFKYNDNYVDREDAYRHSKWLAFMEKRLKLAKRLLKPAGLIFMSIDDNEEAQLRLLCDEIFDGKNFVAMLPTIMNLKGNQDQFGFAGTHEYTLVYAKDFTQAKIGEFQLNDEDWDNWEEDEGGFFKKGANLKATGVNAPRAKRPNLFFPIFITTDGFYVTENDKPKSSKDLILLPITDGKEMSWRWSKGKIKNETGNLIIERNVNGATIYKKQRPSIGDLPSKKPKTIFYKPEYSSGNGTAQLKNILGSKAFNNPKPMDLIKDFVTLSTPKDGVVLDFMAGSGTTGHAVLELNKEDGGNRKFILCTNNESNIATDVCYPRIKKVIKGFNSNPGLGGNLKYFKTSFVKKGLSKDDLKIRLTRECTEMLCLREGIFDEIKSTADYKIFKQGDRVMGIYYSLNRDALKSLKKDLDKTTGDKTLYCFTIDPLGLDKNDFTDWDNVTLEPIPQKILDVYDQIYEY